MLPYKIFLSLYIFRYSFNLLTPPSLRLVVSTSPSSTGHRNDIELRKTYTTENNLFSGKGYTLGIVVS